MLLQELSFFADFQTVEQEISLDEQAVMGVGYTIHVYRLWV